MNTTRRFTSVLFDLDGTLTDPAVGITKSVRYALLKSGIEVTDTGNLLKFIGPPLRQSFMRFYGMDSERAERAVSFYHEYFSVTGIFENRLFDGIPELLGRLRAGGARLLVATSKPGVFAAQICDHFGISAYFTAIEGSELDGRRSDKGELIAHVLETHGITADSAVMVGDREHDIIGARKNGLRSIGVGYGYGTEDELIASGATWYAPTIRDLSALLAGTDGTAGHAGPSGNGNG